MLQKSEEGNYCLVFQIWLKIVIFEGMLCWLEGTVSAYLRCTRAKWITDMSVTSPKKFPAQKKFPRQNKLLSRKLLSDRLGWFSILLENECFENPENQPKWLASLLILNKLFEKNGCNQNLRLVELIFMVYFILSENPV